MKSHCRQQTLALKDSPGGHSSHNCLAVETPLGPKTLVFEKDKFSYQKFISDLIGIDTKAHTDNSSFWLHIEILTLFLSQLLYILSTDDAVNEIDHSQV